MHEVNEMVEPDALAQSLGPFNAARGEIQAGHATTAPVGKPTRRAANATAYVEHMMLAVNSRKVCELVQSIGATVMVLVEVLEVILGQGIDGNAARSDLGENLVLVDRMGVIELDYCRSLSVIHFVAPMKA
jgi:hypothetical protein